MRITPLRVIGGVLFFFATITALSSFSVVQTGTVGVMHTWGKANMNELQPGLHWKIPFAQSIIPMDVKANTINYNKGDQRGGNGIKNKEPITIMDKRSLPVSVDLSVIYRLSSAEAAETLYEFGQNYDEKLINPVVRDIVRSAFGQYTAETIAEKREEIGGTVKAKIVERFEGTPFQIVDVQLRDIQLPPQINERMLQVQKKNQEVELARQELEKQEVEAQTIVVQAKAEADMKIEKARGEAESKKAIADADAYAIRETKNAEAEGYKAMANAISNGVIKLEELKVATEFASKWQGGVPTIVSEGANTIIPAGMENLGINVGE